MRLKINPLEPDKSIIKEAVEILENNGIVVYPTETAYGIGCNAYISEAVEKIFTIKQRPKNLALPVIVSSIDMINEIAYITPQAEILMKNFYPGPLVIALQKKDKILDIVNAYSIAFRIPGDKISFSLVQHLNRPIISTSANRSGFPSPYSVEEVLSSLNEEDIDIILDVGPIEKRKPSTIIDFTETPSPQITRIGEISPEKIFEILGIKKGKWTEHLRLLSP
ncbi:MAG: L-threonylcarbamoyladenylate synthase [Candidatus Thorarchaeota archaeon]